MNASPRPDSADSAFITLATRHFGEIQVREDQIIQIIPGLLGFSQYHRYVLIEHSKESPFIWLQSVDNLDLAFVVIDPVNIVLDYQVSLGPDLLKELEADSLQDLEILVVLTIPPGRPQEMTANLMGPLVINLHNRRGKQLVVEQQDYSHKHRVLPQ